MSPVFKSKKFGFGRGATHAAPAHYLNLTPMIDVMVIILIFLVKSYSVTPEYLSPAQGLNLTAVSSDTAAPDRAAMAITKEGIRIHDKVVVTFSELKKNALEENVWPQLQQALIRLQKDKKFQKSDILIIQADRDLPFDFMKPVIRSAAAAGFKDIKFAGVFED